MTGIKVDTESNASILKVLRAGDWVGVSLWIKSATDWVHCPVSARIDGDKLVELTTTIPECFEIPQPECVRLAEIP